MARVLSGRTGQGSAEQRAPMDGLLGLEAGPMSVSPPHGCPGSLQQPQDLGFRAEWVVGPLCDRSTAGEARIGAQVY